MGEGGSASGVAVEETMAQKVKISQHKHKLKQNQKAETQIIAKPHTPG